MNSFYRRLFAKTFRKGVRPGWKGYGTRGFTTGWFTR
jgi:hypothetical protein